MKILVLSVLTPFVRGPIDQRRDTLVSHLLRAGADAEAMSIPFKAAPVERLIDEMMIARSLQVTGADRLIALQFPVHLVPHAYKILWLHDPLSPGDEPDSEASAAPPADRDTAIRTMIRTAEAKAFAESRAVFAASDLIRSRVQQRNGLDADVLAPLSDADWPATVARLMS